MSFSNRCFPTKGAWESRCGGVACSMLCTASLHVRLVENRVLLTLNGCCGWVIGDLFMPHIVRSEYCVSRSGMCIGQFCFPCHTQGDMFKRTGYFALAAISIWTRTGDLDHVLIVGSYFHYTGRLDLGSPSWASCTGDTLIWVMQACMFHTAGQAFLLVAALTEGCMRVCFVLPVQAATLSQRHVTSPRRPASLAAGAIPCMLYMPESKRDWCSRRSGFGASCCPADLRPEQLVAQRYRFYFGS